MSARRRICALEQKAELEEDLDGPVTFIEMAHGIRDELWRKGKSPRALREAREKLQAASAKFRDFLEREQKNQE